MILISIDKSASDPSIKLITISGVPPIYVGTPIEEMIAEECVAVLENAKRNVTRLDVSDDDNVDVRLQVVDPECEFWVEEINIIKDDLGTYFIEVEYDKEGDKLIDLAFCMFFRKILKQIYGEMANVR